LAYATEAELRQLVAQLPEVDAVIGGPTGQAIAPQRVGRTVLAAATNKGKFLIQLTLSDKPGEPITGSAIEMEETYPDQPQQQENLQRFYQLLTEQDFTPSQTSFAAVLPYSRSTSATSSIIMLTEREARLRVLRRTAVAACRGIWNGYGKHMESGHTF
jgi:hypothetical protein